MPVKKVSVQNGKTYTLRDVHGTYTLIVGDLIEGGSSSSSSTDTSNLHVGVGLPSTSLGKVGGIYLDSLNKRVYVKDAIGWDSGFDMGGSGGSSEFKVGVGAPTLNLSSSISAYIDMQNMTFHTRSGGSWDEGRLMRGSAGTNGKSVRFGNGPPIASLGENDETYIDLNDFKIHTKSSGAWSNGQVFKGNNGQNGKSLRFGNGLPSDTDGEDDEVYLDLSNFKVHSKSAGTWGSGHIFKGDNGQNGLNGKSLRFGNGAPSDSDGDDDEVYLDLSNFKIHPKSAGSWGSGHAFKGSDGLNGSNGLNGKSIKFGNGLPSDSDGEDDEVYLDLSNFKIHTKATGSWNTGIAFKGANGNDGSNGKDGSDGSPGKDGVTAQLTNDSDVIPTDSDGTGYDFTDTGGEFELRSGGTKITSGVTYYAGAAGTSSSVIVNGLTLSITSGGVYSLSGASWSQPFAKFTMRAIHEGVTYTKVYKVTKARSGIKGGDGLNGSDGVNGKDGADGTDAVTGHLSNEADVIPAANDGTGYSFANTGGTFYVYSGKTQVSPSNFYVGASGTATSQTISGLTLSITSGGVYSLSGASWTTDSASFTLRAVYSGTTLTKVYKITKSKIGSKGDIGVTGADGLGIDRYVDSLLSDVTLSSGVEKQLYYNDLVSDVGSILTKTGTTTSGSTFTISAAGRYKIDLVFGFKAVYTASASVNYTASLLVNDYVKRTASSTSSSMSATTRYPSIELSWMGFLPANSTIKCKVSRDNSDADVILYANAIDKGDLTGTQEDTTITITKL